MRIGDTPWPRVLPDALPTLGVRRRFRMRRATFRLVLVAIGLTLLLPAGGVARDDMIDGTMMVDYSKPPSFKIGTWVRYHTVGSSLLGLRRNYTLTLLIAGEEDVWGDRCFWLETWTQQEGKSPDHTASLISYSAFGDTAALRHAMWFIRKMVTGPSGRVPGEPEFSLWTRDGEDVRQRSSALRKQDPLLFRGTTFDTLGPDTAMVPRGTYRGTVVRERSQITLETMYGDSTHRDERVEVRTRNMSDDIPITHLVRERVHDLQKRKRWLLGRSNDATQEVLEEGTMRTMVIEYGHGGLTPAVIPPRLRVTIEEQQARRRAAQPASASRKRGG